MKKTRFFTLLLTLLLVFSVSMAVSASPAPEVSEEISESIAILEDGGTDISNVEGENAAEAAPPQQGGNTPLFIGAALAVLMFAGVAVYCKVHGNKTP